MDIGQLLWKYVNRNCPVTLEVRKQKLFSCSMNGISECDVKMSVFITRSLNLVIVNVIVMQHYRTSCAFEILIYDDVFFFLILWSSHAWILMTVMLPNSMVFCHSYRMRLLHPVYFFSCVRSSHTSVLVNATLPQISFAFSITIQWGCCIQCFFLVCLIF